MTDNIIISFRPSLFLFVSFRRGWSRAICKKEKKKTLPCVFVIFLWPPSVSNGHVCLFFFFVKLKNLFCLLLFESWLYSFPILFEVIFDVHLVPGFVLFFTFFFFCKRVSYLHQRPGNST